MENIKKFENFLDRVQGLLDNAKKQGHVIVRVEDLENAFPELKESEDKRVIKALKKGFKYHQLFNPTFGGIPCIEIVNWLEKQGELSICNIPSREVILAIWDLGNEWKELTNGCISTEYGTQLKYIQKHWQESEYYLRVMQDKQNHVDTVEPKFKVGDWVVSDVAHEDYRICKILSDNDGEYIIESIYGYRGHNSFETFDKDYRLWTIQNAKDGDVLVDKSHVRECVFIFKEARPSDIKTDVNNPLAIIGYCGINHIGFTSQLSGLGFGDTVNCIYYPATKEQRNLLFQKMKEAGYEWDANKKELKKINSYCQENCKGFQETGRCFADGECKAKREAEQKPTEWHREDEQNLNACLGYIPVEFLRRWLKDVVHEKYDKPAWSEEDERNLEGIIDEIKANKNNAPDYDLETYDRFLSWLKSIKQRIGE